MNKHTLNCDVLVVGAGPAGLTMACLLARGGVNTIVVGPVAGAGDTRTTALFGGAEQLLANLGAGPDLAGKSAPLTALRIVDRLSNPSHPSSLVFPAVEIGLQAFGSNYRNTELLAVLEEIAGSARELTRIHEMVTSYRHHENGIEAHLTDGLTIRARAIAACDGHRSPARTAAGISARTWDYGQTAMAFQVRHQRPHRNVSIEVHHPGGPLTFIPLPGHRSAVNWLLPPDEAAEIEALDSAAFGKALLAASGGVLGTFTEIGRRAAFAISGLSVDCLAKNRTVLVGEAAHVLPPIGAQGLNLGFRDAAVFAELAIEAVKTGNDPGHAGITAAYCRARGPDVMTRRTATDLLNRSLLLGGAAMPHLRELGLVLLGSSVAARRKLMTEGMGTQDSQPKLMRLDAPPARALSGKVQAVFRTLSALKQSSSV